ncbi:MAG: hypothetical protein DMF76_21745 [Acidobacteria bacterium]|nr:MAG: hypothetical protein DMF76_21745 [Acidobacteriota bacterium]
MREVRKIDATRFAFSWLRDGKERQCVVRVLLRIPEQRIAWRTISHGLAFGVVSFERTFNQDTEITLRIRSIYDQKVITTGKEDARSHRLRQLETQSSQKDT